ncbi:M55 family metallopeptidase [Microvirga thermotolerans]|uniref:Aminopeptidase n=1 Tax=Microvirga thermotolerans TaxID=2651334 RepID=A0A5P9JWD2_9HYPH|nr:M55 family metallopeptidase [Microvirga thermotolerans]QFU16743.1 aminopeptidase [Microvirga thermotolerans]
MKIYISADIEGVAGVVSPQHGTMGNAEYERARRLMTQEVNAAIDGAFAGGATEVLVNDSHGDMRNLLPEELDRRAEAILGKPKPLNMFEGLTREHAGVFCTGYHARARAPGVLAHTVNGFAFGRIRLNGLELGEAGLYGAYAGSLGVPVLLLTGDDCLREETKELFPDAAFAVVKRSLGQRAARSLAPERARALIREKAAEAVRTAAAARPFVLDGPYRLEVEFNTPALCDLAAVIPAATRLDAVTVAFAPESAEHAVRWVNTLSALSSFLR